MNDTQNTDHNINEDITENAMSEQEAAALEIEANQEADRQEHAARMESIRQLAKSGELEVLPEQAEIVEALLDTMIQRDEMQGKLIRATADHQNFQRRASGNEREARTGATQGVVQSLVPLLDTFEMALLQDPEKVAAEQVIEGVKLIRDEFLRMLSGYGVSSIDPKVGDEFNPMEHAAMMQQAVEGIEPGHISINMGIGYKLGDRVVRPAKVAVVPVMEEPVAESVDTDSGED
tara:strand:+ start:106152 stop:106853 length:702 start_codon:yes stop_codon:yes gene_type:complete